MVIVLSLLVSPPRLARPHRVPFKKPRFSLWRPSAVDLGWKKGRKEGRKVSSRDRLGRGRNIFLPKKKAGVPFVAGPAFA